MKNIIKIFLVSISSLILLLLIDFFAGEKILNLIVSDPEKKFRKSSSIYHHDLKKNINQSSKWGDYIYRICTDDSGFKIRCLSKDDATKEFDIGFIGDSFTEGIGLNYEDTFVGIYKEKNKDLKIANLGVVSYSPSIYYAKINELIKLGYKFKKIIVFIDISDIQDEAISYRLQEDRVIPFGEFSKNYYFKRYINDLFPITYNSLLNLRYLKNLFSKQAAQDISIYSREYERAGWTWGVQSGYGDVGIEGGIQLALESMNKLYLLLNKNKINLVVAVYPWPGQLLYDKPDSKQVSIWKNFCINKCHQFIDLFPLIFSQSNSIDDIIEKYYIRNDVHFNKNGNSLIANYLNLNLIKDK